MKIILLALLSTLSWLPIRAQGKDEVLSLGVPYLHNKGIYQELFLKYAKVKVESVAIRCFDITNDIDSIPVYSVKTSSSRSKRKDAYYSKLLLSADEGSAFNPVYKDILLKNYSLPAGNYCTYLTLKLKDSTINAVFIHYVDSLFSSNTTANKEFNKAYGNSTGKSFLGLSSVSTKVPTGHNNTASKLKRLNNKITRRFNSKGFVVSYRQLNSTTFADVQYQNRYVGYYEVDMNEPIGDKIEKRKARLADNLGTDVSPKLQSNKPVFSQMRDLHSDRKKKEVVGNISLTGNTANGQEENSESDNNYYEVAMQVEAPIMNLPFLIEGFYTSQDKDRIAKSSYFRLHYDASKAKSELVKMISDYKSKYNEASAKGKGMESVYGTYIGKLYSEKDKLWSLAMAEAGISKGEKFKLDTSGLFQEITEACKKKGRNAARKESSEANDTKLEAEQRYRKAQSKYRQIKDIEGRIQRYQTLLKQYRNNNYFDSVMVYDKIRDINAGSADEKTYKQLSKSARGFLPEGESKKFTTGLTNLDIGIFAKEISAYTLNGQTIKGVDVGYDVGVCETGFTYGRVEYVGRDGQLDKYSGYSGRTVFRPARRQKTTLIYFGYMPSGKMLKEEGFFKEVDTYMPAFRTPIHIVSAVHTGEITKHVNMEAEAATSFRTTNEFRENNLNLADKMAYRINVEGDIPKTQIDLKGSYEHIGKRFENNTLPINLSGTEKYTVGGNSQFYNGFLALGVEYNYLVQQNFASKSVNSKWGFEVKTVSKRYPSATLSYRPFTTFRSFSDTFNVPQRPILGAVWLGKLSYQVKRNTYTLRLTAIHNRNTALVDTVESGSNVTQLNAIYTQGRLNLMLNAGRTQVKANNNTSVQGKTNFLTLGAAYALSSQWDINGGNDLGMRKDGLSRYGINLGCGYRFKSVPLSLRTSFRYNTYQATEGQSWKNIYSGMLDLNWQFRFKIKDEVQ